MKEKVYGMSRGGLFVPLSKRPSLPRGTRLIYHYYAGNTTDYILLDDETGRAALADYAKGWPDNIERINERFMEPSYEYDYRPGPFVQLDEYARHIKDQFGIGIYYTDEVAPEAECIAAEQSCFHAEQVIKERKEMEAEQWRKALEEQRAKWGGILKENPSSTKERTDNIRAFLKHEFPGVKFSVRKADYSKAYASWTDGPARNEVQKALDIFQTGHSDPTGDYWDDTSNAFNSLYGGWSYGVDAEREFSDEVYKKIADELRSLFPDIPEEEHKMTRWSYDRIAELEDFLGCDSLGYMDWLTVDGLMYYAKIYKPLEAPKKEEAKPEVQTASGLTVAEYSEKAIVVRGDTRPLAGMLKELGGRFNARLQGGAGWIFSKRMEDKVRQALGIA